MATVAILQNRVSRVSTEFASLDAAVAALGATDAVLTLAPGDTKTLTGDLTIPANVTLSGQMGVIATNGHTLTIQGDCPEVDYQLFDLSGGGSVVGLKRANPRMFGFTSGDVAAYANAAINAVASGGGYVRIGSGTYEASDTIVVPAGVTLHIDKAAVIEATDNVAVIQLKLGGQIVGDGMIDLSNYAATGIYVEGESSWNTAADTAPINGGALRIFGDYTVGQTGIHLYADNDNFISFLKIIGPTVQRCYYGVRLEAPEGSLAYVNGNTLHIDVAGAVYAWYLGDAGEDQRVAGNICRGQVQTTPQTVRVLYCNTNNNVFDLYSWDFGPGDAGFPTGFELGPESAENRVIVNQIRAGQFLDFGSNNDIQTTHWLKRTRLQNNAPGAYFYSAFSGSQDDLLLGAADRYTVSSDWGSTTSQLRSAFNANGSDYLVCTTAPENTPQSVTVEFGGAITGIDTVGVHFGQNCYAKHVLLEADTTGSGDWETIAQTDNNTTYHFAASTDESGQAGTSVATAYALRLTVHGYAPNQSQIRIARFYAFSRHAAGSLLRPDSVTGSKSSGAALESLLTVLKQKGIILDNTTA